MSFVIDTGGGQAVTVNEPQRSMFANNLGGAVSYSLAHTLYKVMEVMGGATGAFLAGLGVRFLERIEPSLVIYTKPLLDMLLEAPDLDPHLRQFLEQLRAPTHEGAAAILEGLGATAGGSVVNSVLGSLTWPVTAWLNHKINPARPSPAEAWAMYWRGMIDDRTRTDWLNDEGYMGVMQTAYAELARSRIDPGTIAQLINRGWATIEELRAECAKRGMTADVADKIYAMSRTYLGAGDTLSAWLRGIIPLEQLNAQLTAQGFKPADIETLKNLAYVIPPVNDLITMSVREAFSEDVVRTYGYDEGFPAEVATYTQQQGLTREWALRYWRAHWNLPSVQMGFDMLHRNVIDKPDLETLLRVADYPLYWRDKLIAISYAPYTRVDARRMYGLGILDRAGVKRAYLDLGYDEEHAENLTEFTIRYEDDNGASKKVTYQNLTQTVIIRAYTNGMLNRQEAAGHLQAIEYTPEDANFLLDLADTTKMLDNKPDYSPQYAKDMTNLIEASYAKALIDRTTAAKMLTDLGLSPAETEYRLTFVEKTQAEKDTDANLNVISDAYKVRAIDKPTATAMIGRLGIPAIQQDRLFGQWEVEREVRSRRLTEAQYRAAYTTGLITDQEYMENLRGLGYTESDIALLLAMIQTQAEQAAQARPKPKMLTITQYVQALADKTITKEQFLMVARQLGYQEVDITILIAAAMKMQAHTTR